MASKHSVIRGNLYNKMNPLTNHDTGISFERIFYCLVLNRTLFFPQMAEFLEVLNFMKFNEMM